MSNSIRQMNVVFMPGIALVTGHVWQTAAAPDRECIARTIKVELDVHIHDRAFKEPRLIENVKATNLSHRNADPKDAEAVIAELDKIWQPKAPSLSELRAAAKTIA